MVRFAIASVLALVVVFGILYGAEILTSRRFAFDTVGMLSSGLRICLLGLATYLGIIGQVITSRLKQSSKARISIAAEFREASASPDFWLAMIASPLVLAAAYGAVAQITSSVLVFFVGFQNGYFFHSVLARQDPAKASR
jgi:hypothetical protein